MKVSSLYCNSNNQTGQNYSNKKQNIPAFKDSVIIKGPFEGDSKFCRWIMDTLLSLIDTAVDRQLLEQAPLITNKGDNTLSFPKGIRKAVERAVGIVNGTLSDNRSSFELALQPE